MQQEDYHIIDYENEYLLYIVNSFRLMKINKLCKEIFEDYFIKEKNVNEISEAHKINEKSINEYLETISNLRLSAPPIAIEDVSESATIKINVSNACNLNCLYCYADYRSDKEMMSQKTADSVVDFITNRLKAKNIVITFFGGEPLLNIDLIEYFCMKLNNIRTKKITFSVITNGTLMNEKFVNIANKYNLIIRISIDGPKNVHDILRPYKNGIGSFQRIKKNIKYLLTRIEKNKISYEATYTNVHEKFKVTRKEVQSFLKEEFDIENGLIMDCEDPISYIPSKEVCEKQFVADEAYLNCLDNFIKKRYKKYACSTGIRHFTISAKGDIYPCHRFLGYKNMSMGNVSHTDIDNSMYERTKIKLIELDKTRNIRCKKCWARMLCQYCPAAEMSQCNDFIAREEKCNGIKEVSKNFLRSIYDITINKKKLI